MVFDRVEADGHEQVVYCHDRATRLRAIIAIHSTVLGPSLGGTRFLPYPSEGAALDDVLRLSRAMTYKAAVAGLELGGGKAVVLGDPRTDRTDELILAYGHFVDRVGGRYITAEDVGTTEADMNLIQTATRWVTGVSESRGGSGDTSPATAWGLLHAMRAVALHLWGDRSLATRHVTISGVGKVGSHLASHLVADGARVTVADVDDAAVARVAKTAPDAIDVVAPDAAHAIPCDIYSPCALGDALNRQTIPELGAAAVVGGANNQLADPTCVGLLAKAGVLYAPDYVVNAGGLINVADELQGYNRERAWKRIDGIFETTLAVLERADADEITPDAAAARLAEDRLAAAAQPPS